MHLVSSVTDENRIGTRAWLALGAMALGVFLIANDFTALPVAIPRIKADLHTTLGGTPTRRPRTTARTPDPAPG
jgi:hypothetical protein